MRIKNPISRGGEGWLTQVFYNLIESDQKFNSKSFTEDLENEVYHWKLYTRQNIIKWIQFQKILFYRAMGTCQEFWNMIFYAFVI